MKFYCIENEVCGWSHHINDFELQEITPELLTCPECFSLLLMYEDTKQPTWLGSKPAIIILEEEDP